MALSLAGSCLVFGVGLRLTLDPNGYFEVDAWASTTALFDVVGVVVVIGACFCKGGDVNEDAEPVNLLDDPSVSVVVDGASLATASLSPSPSFFPGFAGGRNGPGGGTTTLGFEYSTFGGGILDLRETLSGVANC